MRVSERRAHRACYLRQLFRCRRPLSNALQTHSLPQTEYINRKEREERQEEGRKEKPMTCSLLANRMMPSLAFE